MVLGVSLGIGIPLFVALILFIVFTSVRRAIARQREAIASEGVVLDSGPQWITIHLKGFRAPGRAVGVGVEKARMSMILTKKALHFVPNRWRFLHFERSGLDHFVVDIEGGALHMHSDDPPNASGTIDIKLPVSNASEWVAALTEAGAKGSPA